MRVKLIHVVPVVLLSFFATACRTAQPSSATAERAVAIENATDVIEVMRSRYAGKWYGTLRFRQNVVRPPNANGVQVPTQVWLEHAEIPGKLRIDQAASYNGTGTMYVGDSVFVFAPGRPVRRLAQRNPLVVLGFDIYRQPSTRSVAVLREEGFDLTRFRRDTWQGRPVYVIGADAGDLHSKQFWIDQERLVFVRMLNPAGPGGTRTAEVRFDQYQPLAGGWISPYVVFLTDGKETMREEYFDIEANVKIPAGLFDPEQWDKVRPN